jgi:hypothetical protein
VSRNHAETTPSQDAMLEQLAYLIFCEGRPGCWRDFQSFTVNAKEYSFKTGTIRNNLSKLKRLGLIEFVYRSTYAYYTVVGENRWKRNSMTLNHTRVCKRDLADMIERMAFEIPAVHDIHLRFESQKIWQTLRVLTLPVKPTSNMSTKSRIPAGLTTMSPISCPHTMPVLATTPISRDLVLPKMTLERGMKGHITIHKTDTVSVILSCSESPLYLDIGGLVRLSCALARIEERLMMLIEKAQSQMLLQTSASTSLFSITHSTPPTTVPPLSPLAGNYSDNNEKILLIPEFENWTVTMWHFGRDSIERYGGEKFEIAWEDFHGEWVRAYSKEMNGAHSSNNRAPRKKRIVRIERQEYPNERLHSAVEHKLSLMVGAVRSSDAAQ